MQPLGNKILVRDRPVGEKKTESGLILKVQQHYREVTVEATSPDSQTTLVKGDLCLCNPGGVEVETGLWLCNENLLDAKI